MQMADIFYNIPQQRIRNIEIFLVTQNIGAYHSIVPNFI